MATVEDVARNAIALAGTDMGVRLAGQWVNRRWKELVRGKRLKTLRRVGELFIPAVISSGTVTATRGSKVVTGDATAQAAWSPDLVDRYIKVKVAWYRIAQYQTTQLILDTEFAEDTSTSVAYNIVKRFHDLPEDVKFLANPFQLMRLHRPVWIISLDRLNSFRPSRPTFGTPIWVAEVGLSLTRRARRIEVYPYPEDDSEILHYVYWEDPPTLAFTDEIPGFISAEVLEEGVLADVYRQMAMDARKEGRMEEMTTLFNMSRSQDTHWRRVKHEAILDEQAFDDSEMVLHVLNSINSGRGNNQGAEIATAYDQVWNS